MRGKMLWLEEKDKEDGSQERRLLRETVIKAHVFLTGNSLGNSLRSRYPLLTKKLTTARLTGPLR